MGDSSVGHVGRPVPTGLMGRENRLNQAMFDLFGKHTFVDRKPKNVLDVGASDRQSTYVRSAPGSARGLLLKPRYGMPLILLASISLLASLI
jgi:hypothetical protein